MFKWYENRKVFISDIYKTILDVLVNSVWGGGFVHVVDFFRGYFNSDDRNIDQILKYAEFSKIKGSFYKRCSYPELRWYV